MVEFNQRAWSSSTTTSTTNMSSIGPQIPPHLLGQRRASSADGVNDVGVSDADAAVSVGPYIPEHLQRSRNVSEEVDEDRGDAAAGTSSIRPQIPEHAALRSTTPPLPGAPRPSTDDDDDEDAYVPALPPTLLSSRSGPSNYASASQPAKRQRRVLGPTLPGQAHDQGMYDDDEGEYEPGPMPMPAVAGARVGRDDGVNEAVREFMEREERRRKEIEVGLRSFLAFTL